MGRFFLLKAHFFKGQFAADALPKAVAPGLRNFTSALVERGAKVVFLTHAAPDAASAALAPLLGENVSVFQDETDCYGFPRWDAWRRASHANGLPRLSAVVVNGSGFGVRSALLAGMGSMAVVKPRTSYQDFTGADDVVKDISAATARRLLARLFRQA